MSDLTPQQQPPSRYFPPPEGYVSPAAAGCAVCGAFISFVPVVGGVKWAHTPGPYPGHDVVTVGCWWDVSTGVWHEPEDTFLGSGS